MSTKKRRLQQIDEKLGEVVEISFKYFQHFYFIDDKCKQKKEY